LTCVAWEIVELISHAPLFWRELFHAVNVV
jgi:hypothetical protein